MNLDFVWCSQVDNLAFLECDVEENVDVESDADVELISDKLLIDVEQGH